MQMIPAERVQVRARYPEAVAIQPASVSRRIEIGIAFVLICAFWGLILSVALGTLS